MAFIMIYHDFIRGFKYRVEYIYIYIYIFIFLGGVKLRDLKKNICHNMRSAKSNMTSY